MSLNRMILDRRGVINFWLWIQSFISIMKDAVATNNYMVQEVQMEKDTTKEGFESCKSLIASF